jgi:Tol biopolymer transport system component
VTLTWTSPGDDGTEGRAAVYELRYAAHPFAEEGWDSATAVTYPPIPRPAGETQRFNVAGLPLGTYYFALKTADEVPNWSGCSNGVSGTVADLVPPGPVNDLLVTSTTAHDVILSWTAPGNDGASGLAAQYDIRYALFEITDETWDAATRADGAPHPADPGSREEFTIHGLENGRFYYFALKTADEGPNWSVLSNLASTTVEDLEPPSAVTDLAIIAGTSESLTLSWTAPGNSGAYGRAAEYDIRYSPDPIGEGTWEAATRIEGVPAPDSSGTQETFTVVGLEAGQTVHFALKAADERPNWSVLSNDVSGRVMAFTLRRLTTSPAGRSAYAPTWSPDGEHIAFYAYWNEHANSEIYRIPASGGTPIRLTDNPARDEYPSWSPDGGKISFTSERSGLSELWVMNASDGSQPTKLTHHDKVIYMASSWSPDGTRIAYELGECRVSISTSDIYIIPSTGGTPELFEAGDEYSNFDPSWSPDGTRIAFVSSRDGRWEIFVKPLTGGYATQLTFDYRQAGHPTWSPDGTRIAFNSNRGGDFNIWSISPSGADLFQLTSGPTSDWSPAWSPDGTRVAFSSSRAGTADIWILEMR